MNDQGENKSITLELFHLLWKHRKPFLISYLSIVLVVVIFAFVAPKWYRSEVTFFVEEEVRGAPLQNMLLTTPLAFLGSRQITISRYLAMLYSRSLLAEIIDEFDLEGVYGKEDFEALHEELLSHLIFRDNLDGSISIICYYKGDPEKAARMANETFRLLRDMDERLTRQKATEYRKYMEDSYRQALNTLMAAEEEMRDYQHNFGLVSLEEQKQNLIELVADLESRKILYEIRRDYLRKIAGGDYPELLSVMARINTIDEKLQSLRVDSLSTDLTTGELPDRDLEFLRLYREVSIREKVVNFLTTNVEQAKIDERKEVTSIVLIDTAVPAERHARPRRLQIITLASFFGLFLSIFSMLVLEFYQRHRSELKAIVTDRDGK